MARAFTQYTPLSEATKILRENVSVSPREEVAPIRAAYGRVLSSDVVSKVDVPPFDSSHMDGFAVIAEDLVSASESNPARLRLRRGVSIGKFPSFRLGKGEAYSILTGGFMPENADAVVPVERTVVEGGVVVIKERFERGSFVYGAGTDVKSGEVIFPRSKILRSQDIALLASLHIGKVKVYRKPRVTIIATGSELTRQIERPGPGRITETHSLVISRLVESAGGVSKRVTIARDEPLDIKRKLRQALADCEVVLTMAGTSMGKPDITADCVNSLGEPGVLVHGVKVHRGRVMGFGVVRGKAIVILPGPIQGAVNAFIAFGYPLIRSFLGRSFEAPPRVYAALTSDWQAFKNYENFSKVVYLMLAYSANGFEATPVVGETEKMTVLTSTNGYMIVGEDMASLKRGDRVEAFLLPGFSFTDSGLLE